MSNKNSVANIILPSSSADRKKVRDAIIEGANSLVRIDSEKEHIKSIKTMLKEEFEIPPAYVSKMIKLYHKQNLSEFAGQAETLVELYEEILGGSTTQL